MIRLFSPRLAFPHLVWARIRLVQKAFAGADPFLARLRAWAERESLNEIVLETAILQALSAQAQNDETTAFNHLTTALSLAAPEGYIRLFIDEGPPMLHLLRQAVRKRLVRGPSANSAGCV